VSVLCKGTKSSLQKVSNQKQRSVCDRMKAVAKKSDEVLTEYLSSDTAKNFFQAAHTLFNPGQIVLGCSEREFENAKNDIELLNVFPLPNFKVLHSLLSDAVKEGLNSENINNRKKRENDIVCEALLSMKAEHPDFYALCLQVLHMPVSNVDSERAFSAYNDILSPKRCRMSAENTEIMLCMYFSDEIDLDSIQNDTGTGIVGEMEQEPFDDLNPDDPPHLIDF